MEVEGPPIEALPGSGNVFDRPERLLEDYIPFFVIMIHAE
jgi:hypothetical protein